MLAAALAYADEGLEVLPLHRPWRGSCSCRRGGCTSVAKHPLVRHGVRDASADPDVLRGWWARWPGANVGVRPPDGVAILDVDPRAGGDVALAQLEQRHGELPRTRTAVTGGDGLHYWWRTPATVGRIGEGLDVKTAAGYVVGAPSVHASGSAYVWTDEGDVGPAPGWLAALLAPAPAAPPPRAPAPTRGITRGAVAAVLDVVLDAREGGRNNALHWSACRLYERVRDGQLDDAAARGMLDDAAAAVGLAAREATATIGSARRAVCGG